MNFFISPPTLAGNFVLRLCIQHYSGFLAILGKPSFIATYSLPEREEVFLLLSFNIFSSLSPWLIAFLIIFFFLMLNYLLHTMQVSQ